MSYCTPSGRAARRVNAVIISLGYTLFDHGTFSRRSLIAIPVVFLLASAASPPHGQFLGLRARLPQAGLKGTVLYV